MTTGSAVGCFGAGDGRGTGGDAAAWGTSAWGFRSKLGIFEGIVLTLFGGKTRGAYEEFPSVPCCIHECRLPPMNIETVLLTFARSISALELEIELLRFKDGEVREGRLGPADTDVSIRTPWPVLVDSSSLLIP